MCVCVCVCVCVCDSVVSNSLRPHGLLCPRLLSPQAPLSTEISRKEYWSGLLFPTLGDLPNPGTEPMSPALQADSSPSETPGKPENPYTWPKPSSLTFHLRQWRLREVQKLTQRSTLMSPSWVTTLMVLKKK